MDDRESLTGKFVTVDPGYLWDNLKKRGYFFYAGVPDSTFGRAYRAMMDDPEIRYVPAVREDVALGVASAAYFTGRKGAVVMQNSGIGNIVNSLTSFSLMYRIPVLLVIGWRGYGGPPSDAPEHWIMGDKSEELLNMLGVPTEVPEPGGLDSAMDSLTMRMDEMSIPGALLVRPGALD